MKKTDPMVIARWKTAAYKSNSAARRFAEVLVETEASTTPGTEEDFKPQKANAKKGFHQWRDAASRRWQGLHLDSRL